MSFSVQSLRPFSKPSAVKSSDDIIPALENLKPQTTQSKAFTHKQPKERGQVCYKTRSAFLTSFAISADFLRDLCGLRLAALPFAVRAFTRLFSPTQTGFPARCSAAACLLPC